MGEKDKEKGESKKKEEVSPINADPNLDTIVLHALVEPSVKKIIKKRIDSKKEDLDDEQG